MRNSRYAVVVEDNTGVVEVVSPLTSNTAMLVAQDVWDACAIAHPEWDIDECRGDNALYSPDESEWFNATVVHIYYDLGVKL
jgi:hypothetical protein